MPPFRSERFDPYGEGAAATNAPLRSNTSLPLVTARQRTLVNEGRTTDSNGRSTAGGGHSSRVAGGNGGSSSNGRRRPAHSGENSIHSRISGGNHDVMPQYRLGGVETQAFPQGQNVGFPRASYEGNGFVIGKTGAAALTTQIHPLMEVRKRNKPQSNADGYNNAYSSEKYRGGGSRTQHSSTYTSTASNFISQSWRVLSLLIGRIPEEDALALQKQQHYGLGSSEEQILLNLLSAKSTVRILRLFLLIPLLIFSSKRVFPPLADRITRPNVWNWSAGVALPGQTNVARRNLAGRNCVMTIS